jgi:hypothetical protein
MQSVRAFLLIAALLLTTASPAEADGSFIVYQCGDNSANLCRVQPDGGGQTALTSDGRRDGSSYAAPSLSRDGTRLAFNFANQTFVVAGDPARRGNPVARAAGLVALRPDGAWLATTELFSEQTMVPGPTGPTFFRTFTPFVITYNLATGERAMTSRRPGTLAWAGDRLITSGPPTQSKRQTLCILKPDQVTCERTLAQDNGRDLTDPAVSPDGSQLALASCAQPERKGCSLAVYAMGSGAKVRDLTAGPDDTGPAWAPDGASIVFTRAGDLFLVAADGGPGAERLLVRGGRNPTWGGTASSSPVEPTLPPPEPMLPPPAEPLPPSPADDPVQLAVASAAEQLQVPAEQLMVVRVEQTDWSDASLGCPEADRAYAQVIVPGFLVVLATDDGATELHVHTDQGQRAVIC